MGRARPAARHNLVSMIAELAAVDPDLYSYGLYSYGLYDGDTANRGLWALSLDS